MAAGDPIAIVAVDDEVNWKWLSSFHPDDTIEVSVRQISKSLKTLKSFHEKVAMMADQVKSKNVFMECYLILGHMDAVRDNRCAYFSGR
jgi:hypothetical protein